MRYTSAGERVTGWGKPLIVCALLALTGSAFGGTVILSVPQDTTVKPGSALLLPVRVSELTAADSVIGFNFAVMFPSDVLMLNPTSIDTTLRARITIAPDSSRDTVWTTSYRYREVFRGSLTGQGFLDNTIAGDTLRIAWSNSSPIVGSGTLLSISFLVADDVADETVRDVKIIRLNGLPYVNEGDPPSVAESGVVRVNRHVAVHERRPERFAPQISAWPNPFNPRVTIRLSGWDDRGGPVEGMIVNALGQTVRRWTMPGFATDGAGALRWTWNGRDDAGRPVSSGVYIVMVWRGGERYRTTVTLLR